MDQQALSRLTWYAGQLQNHGYDASIVVMVVSPETGGAVAIQCREHPDHNGRLWFYAGVFPLADAEHPDAAMAVLKGRLAS